MFKHIKLRAFELGGKAALLVCQLLTFSLKLSAFSLQPKHLLFTPVIIIIIVSLSMIYTSPVLISDFKMNDNTIYLDKFGKAIYFMPDKAGERHLWMPASQIPEIVKKAFIAAEDKRFYTHSGFDLIALTRALKNNIKYKKIVSGASTISQQLLRLVYPHRRSYLNKIREVVKSIKLETLLTKEEILTQYLNRVPMGNNMVGIELASKSYFGKSANNLNAAQAALLASLPKAPGYLNPYGKNKDKLLIRKNKILGNMFKLDYLSKTEFNKAKKFILKFNDFSFPRYAGHLIDKLYFEKSVKGIRKTTIDLTIQNLVERILKSHETRLSYRGANQAAAIVVYNSGTKVLAYSGSLSYSFKNKGYNDGGSSLRSAGSTLKPFLYGLSLERGFTAASLLEDTLKKYRAPEGNYFPSNYDRMEYGPVTLRTALGNSFNISAVKMIGKLKPGTFYALLKRAGLVTDFSKDAGFYGMGLAVGNLEVTLEKLVSAYAALANGGIYRPLNYLKGNANALTGKRIFSSETSYIISDILSDPSARLITFGNSEILNFPFRVSLKTGTSTKYRDGWAIGYTPDYTIGVWTGNFEGRSTYNLSGASGAVPIFKDILNFLYKRSAPPISVKPQKVKEIEICGISAMKPGPACRYRTKELFIEGTEPLNECTFHKNKNHFHELPPEYASWLFDKEQKGLAGNFRLRGFNTDLKKVFSQDSFKKTGSGYASNIAYELEGSINIIYPLHNDHFISHRENIGNTIRLEAVTTEPVSYIDWYIDGIHYKKTGPPYKTYWEPERGKHKITALLPGNIGDSIKIIVE